MFCLHRIDSFSFLAETVLLSINPAPYLVVIREDLRLTSPATGKDLT
jgi:hypothetical protein